MTSPLPERGVLEHHLALVADTLLGLRYDAWSFGDSIGFEGMLAASRVLKDGRWLGFARGFIRAWAVDHRPFVRLDCTAPGLAMVEIARTTGDDHIAEAALDLADYLVSRPRIGPLFATWDHAPLQHPYGPDALPQDEIGLLASPPAGAFVDCLHFDPPFLVALGVFAGREDLLAEGVVQAEGYVDVLQRPDGTFDHFVLDSSDATYGQRWGRGQGWALLGLLDVLEQLPDRHAAAPSLASAVGRLIDVMLLTQRVDGHWDAIVGDTESGIETSTAAFMAVGFRRALRLGFPVGSATAASADRALSAALGSTTSDGRLEGVSAAVNACTLHSHYAHVPSGFVVPWGQGPLATALAERLQAPPASTDAWP